MQINTVSPYTTNNVGAGQVNSPTNPAANSFQTAAISTALSTTNVDKTTISEAAKQALANDTSASTDKPGHSAKFQTNRGEITLNIESYFSPPSSSQPLLELPPLLMPSQQNVDALTAHISKVFPGFLADNNIPLAPKEISYDNQGQLQLPADYPYADELRTALNDNPSMARELSTVNALTSHVVEMRKSIPFQEEYAAAASQAEANAVIEKYSHLFWGNRSNDSIALSFSENGTLTMTANGKNV